MKRYFYPTIPALVILGIFVLFSNWIPQTRWEPPKRVELGGALTPGELARQGEKLVRNRGCLVCHTIEQGVGEKGRGRGPNLWGISSRPRATLDYLVESLYEPGAFVVEGYASIMPAVHQPPSNLTYEEATAVVAYLQSLGGRPTVKVGDIRRHGAVPQATPQPTPGATPQPTPAPSAGQPVATPRATPTPAAVTPDIQAMLDKYACTACHALAGKGGALGPALDRPGVNVELTATGLSLGDYVRQSLLDPGAHLSQGYPDIMPKDLGARMSPQEREALVHFLAGVKR